MAVPAVLAALLLWACGGAAGGSANAGGAAGKQGTSGDAHARAAASPGKPTTYVSNARNAVGLAIDARGRLLYAEKNTGRIIRVSRGKRTTLARLHVNSGSETGLLGLATDRRGYVWAYYTTSRAGCPKPTSGSSGDALEAHCVWRLRPSGGKLKADKLVFSAGQPSTADNHNGGALHIGPDGALYLGIGDLGENDNPNNGPRRAQDLSVPFGKILRLDPDATNKGAAGNPNTCGNASNSAQRKIVDRRIYACGLRNPFSFDWDLQGRLWVADVGDSCDELNKVKAGVNYGWQPPRTDCAGRGAGRPVLKLRVDGGPATPSGVAVPKSRLAGAWRNDVMIGIWVDSSLKRFDPSSGRLSTVSSARGRAGWDLVAGARYLWMSDGAKISRMRLPGA